MSVEALHSLSWYRLRVSMRCIRMVADSKSLPGEIIQAVIKGVNSFLPEPPAKGELAGLHFHIVGRRFRQKFKENESFELELFLCGYSQNFAEQWRTVFATYIVHPKTEKNFEILALYPLEKRTLADLEAEYLPHLKNAAEVCLEFLTPCSFHPKRKKQRAHITSQQFVALLTSRITSLFDIRPINVSDVSSVDILPYYWNYDQPERDSKSQTGRQYLNGCIGKFYVRGQLSNIMPYLLLCSELHTASDTDRGSMTSYGRGYYRLHTRPAPYFASFFPKFAGVSHAIKETFERYDQAAASLALTDCFPLDENTLAALLLKPLSEGNYSPAPAVATRIPKKNGEERIIERLQYRDLIVQRYLHNVLRDIFDRFFEESSIGFRKGVSRQKSIDLVKSALAQGCQYVVESDIEDFFPTANLSVLRDLLQRHLPAADAPMIDLIMKLATNGFLLEGVYHERTCGLSQGAPLSPLLANLYLDPFDEEVQRLGGRMVRYCDDFILLTETRAEAEQLLSQSEAFLASIGLSINRDKTSIRHVSEGFTFVGIRFDDMGMRELTPQETFNQLKKPLYVVEPYTFIAVNGESVDIIKQRHVIASVPLRRISEIIVLNHASFSSALAHKCTTMHIPLTITLNSGYYVTTIRPDSKQFYTLNHDHARNYYQMSDSERLWLAKEFATGKIRNYISLMKQRTSMGMSAFIHELEDIINEIDRASTVDEIRGHEGWAAKKIFGKLNQFIKFKEFHLHKRDRNRADPINTLMNFMYYHLFSRINATVRSAGLNPYLGFLHSPNNRYESLVCDIEELFRSRIDRLLIHIINEQIVKTGDFTSAGDRLKIADNAKRDILTLYEKELERKNAKNELSLKENIYSQVQQFKHYILGDDKNFRTYEWRV